MQEAIPFKKRKITFDCDDTNKGTSCIDVVVVNNDNNDVINKIINTPSSLSSSSSSSSSIEEIYMPRTENFKRKKCAKTDDGLAIKYNKLMSNFDEIRKFKYFRKYCVLFDVFSRRHLINHEFRIDMLGILNRYDFHNEHQEIQVCFKSAFMERKKYINYKNNKSEYMKNLYEKHSVLRKENNFYDNKINECFLEKIKKYEELQPLSCLDKNIQKILYDNLYKDDIPHIPKFEIVNAINSIDMNNICDNVLKINNEYLIPSYLEQQKQQHNNNAEINSIEATSIIIFKNTKSNIVFLYNNIFHVIKSKNTFIILDIKTFKSIHFFSNFNFYFINKSTTNSFNLNNNNFIYLIQS